MLKEGWDVKNVTTIVGLRAYASHILPEQTLGRGLRRMYFGEDIEEELDVVGTDNFIEYVKAILNSTYKLTKVNDSSETSENIPYEIYNFRKVLEKAKEYLIIGNLKRALDLLKSSNFDDNEIDIWVDDASDLYKAQEKLRSLEFQLFEIVGENSD